MKKSRKPGAGRVGRGITKPGNGALATISMDRVREAVQALKEKHTAHPDYEYDLFVSYIHGSIFQDWLHRVMGVLESWLTLELGRRPLIYYDSRVEMGKAWDRELVHALRTARYLVPILSPGYFQSRWSTAEWQSFIEREKQVGVELVFPICVHESSDYPDEARQIGDTARRTIIERFTVDRMVAGTLEAYRSVLA